MSNSFYQAFRDNKAKIEKERKEELAPLTLKYYEMLTEMLEREEDYGDSFPFLESVYNYVEQHEYITPKQQEIVDRIADNPQNSFGGYDNEYDEPF